MLQLRYAFALLACIVGGIFIFILYQGALSTQRAATARALGVYAQRTNLWLQEQQNIFSALVADPRLAGTLQDSLNANSRKALYEFRYTQAIKDVYLYDTLSGRLLRAPETLPLSPRVLASFSPENNQPFHAKLTNLNGVPFLITAVRLNYPEQRDPIYAIAAQPMVGALKKLTILQGRIKNHQLGLIYKENAHHYLTNIHNRRPQLTKAPRSIYTNNRTPSVSKIVYQNNNLFVATSQLKNFPEWQPLITITSPPTPYGLITLVAFLTLAAAAAIINYLRILEALKQFKLFFGGRKKSLVKPVGQNNFGSFKAPNAPRGSKYGSSSSSTAPIATPKKLLATLRSTGHLKVWEDVQDSFKEDRTLLLYQPIVDTATNTPLMYEVFLRVIEKNGNQMQPDKFLPAMEHYHAAGNLDTYVLDKILKTHFQDAIPPVGFTINLTGQAFDAISFLTTIMEKLPEEALPLVGFELRHHEIRKDNAAKAFLAECAEMGLRFSVDYFGGGKAMLSIAQKMGFTWVKVTKSALKEEGLTLKQLAADAQEIGIPLILERIETEEELKEANDLGITLVQGYHIGKPLPWEEVLK